MFAPAFLSRFFRISAWLLVLFALAFPAFADANPAKKVSLKDGSVWVGVVSAITEQTIILKVNGKEMVFQRDSILRIEDPQPSHAGLSAARADLKLTGSASPAPSPSAPPASSPPAQESAASSGSTVAQSGESTRGLRFREVESNPRQGWLIAGITMLSIAYGISLIASSIFLATSSTNNTALICGYSLMVPIGGPFVAFGASFSDQSFRAGTPWFLLLGLVQAAGLTFLIIGLTAKPVKVREYYSSGEIQMPRLAVLPYATPDGGGLNVFGTF